MNPESRSRHDRPPPDVPLDADGRLTQSLPCRKCGYDLHGLSVDGRCPECGTAVGWSVHGDLLRYSDPAWVKHQADGALLLILAIGAWIAGAVIDGLASGATSGRAAALAMSMLGSVMALVAIRKVTIPEAARAEEEPPASVRLVTRILGVIGLLPRPILAAVRSRGLGGATGISAFEIVLQTAMMVTTLVAGFLLFILFRRLALRIPDHGLAKRTRIVQWGLAASYGIALGTALVTMIVAPAPGAAAGGTVAEEFVVSLLVVAAIATAGFALWWIELLLQYRTALHGAAAQARSTWMHHAAPQSARC